MGGWAAKFSVIMQLCACARVVYEIWARMEPKWTVGTIGKGFAPFLLLFIPG
jgi:hypothetical protein